VLQKKSGLYVVSNSFSAYKDVETLECLVPQQMSPKDIIIVLGIQKHKVTEINSDYTEIKFLHNGIVMNTNFYNNRFPLQRLS